MRPAGLLALRKKDLVPPLVPLLPCRSIVIAASETGVPTKTGIGDGWVLMDQRWLPWVSSGRLPLSPAPAPKQVGNTRATCRIVVDKATASPTNA